MRTGGEAEKNMVFETMGSSRSSAVVSSMILSKFLTFLSLSFIMCTIGIKVRKYLLDGTYFLVLVWEISAVAHVKKLSTIPAKNSISMGVHSGPNMSVLLFSPFQNSPPLLPSPAQQIQPKECAPSSQSLQGSGNKSLLKSTEWS